MVWYNVVWLHLCHETNIQANTNLVILAADSIYFTLLTPRAVAAEKEGR